MAINTTKLHWFLNSILLLCIVFAISGCIVKAPFNDETMGENVDDTAISAKIKAAFIKNGLRDLYAKITVAVSQGRVMYTGSVSTEEDMINAVDIAWKQNGVKEVINNLDLDSESDRLDVAQYSKDTYITSVVRAKMLATKGVKSTNYTVVTDKNVVYVFGIARSEEELEKVADTIAKVGGVEKVVSHIRIQEKAVPSGSSNIQDSSLEQNEAYDDEVISIRH